MGEYKLMFTGPVDIYKINQDGVYEKIMTLNATVDCPINSPPDNRIQLQGDGTEKFTFEINTEGDNNG